MCLKTIDWVQRLTKPGVSISNIRTSSPGKFGLGRGEGGDDYKNKISVAEANRRAAKRSSEEGAWKGVGLSG